LNLSLSRFSSAFILFCAAFFYSFERSLTPYKVSFGKSGYVWVTILSSYLISTSYARSSGAVSFDLFCVSFSKDLVVFCFVSLDALELFPFVSLDKVLLGLIGTLTCSSILASTLLSCSKWDLVSSNYRLTLGRVVFSFLEMLFFTISSISSIRYVARSSSDLLSSKLTLYTSTFMFLS